MHLPGGKLTEVVRTGAEGLTSCRRIQVPVSLRHQTPLIPTAALPGPGKSHPRAGTGAPTGLGVWISPWNLLRGGGEGQGGQSMCGLGARDGENVPCGHTPSHHRLQATQKSCHKLPTCHQGQVTSRLAADLLQGNMWLPVSPEDPWAPLVRGRVNGGMSSRCPSRTPQHTRVAPPAAPSGETRLQQRPPPSSSSKERHGHWPPIQVTVLSPLSIPSCFLSPGNMPCFGLLLTSPFSEFGETGMWPRAGGLTPLG